MIFQILDLPSRANSTVIRSQYRRLSLKHHPDKNPGNRSEANKKFNEVAKAYKVGALTLNTCIYTAVLSKYFEVLCQP